ncbi:TPA: type IV secretion system protein [Salmonella enterica subsp. enterica serovar Java]|nr:conjugal transfer protein TrbL [Salmonella enterica subsp. diarizonae]EHO7201521.1 type IV secretion system protein [Salmonella enterica]
MSGGIFTGMNNAIMGGLNAVLAGQTSVYGTMISIIATSSFTSYIVFRGYQTLAGKLQRPVEDVMWDIARMLLIMMFVLNIGGWLDITIASINGLKNGFSGSDNVWMLLDTVWAKAQALGQTLYNNDDSTYVKLNGGLSEALVWGGAIFVLITTTIVNLLAEITILLMSTTAPIFIFCLLYGFLRPMFDNWLKTIFTAILTIMLSALFVRIAIKYTNDILDEASRSANMSNMVTLAAQCLLAAVAAGIFIWFSAKIAMALGGAATQAAMQGVAMSGINFLGKKGTSKPAAAAALLAGRGVGKGVAGAAKLAGGGIDYAAGKAADAFTSYGNTHAAAAAFRRAASIQTMQRANQQRLGR